MSTNYAKGRKKEYKILKEARELGHVALRSAGSHSPIDVVDIDLDARVIKFVQCKPDSMQAKAREKLLMDNHLLNGSFFCVFEVR